MPFVGDQVEQRGLSEPYFSNRKCSEMSFVQNHNLESHILTQKAFLVTSSHVQKTHNKLLSRHRHNVTHQSPPAAAKKGPIVGCDSKQHPCFFLPAGCWWTLIIAAGDRWAHLPRRTLPPTGRSAPRDERREVSFHQISFIRISLHLHPCVCNDEKHFIETSTWNDEEEKEAQHAESGVSFLLLYPGFQGTVFFPIKKKHERYWWELI